jgi:hypothetical protein
MRKSMKFVDDFEVVLLIPQALTANFRLKNFYFFFFYFPAFLEGVCGSQFVVRSSSFAVHSSRPLRRTLASWRVGAGLESRTTASLETGATKRPVGGQVCRI